MRSGTIRLAVFVGIVAMTSGTAANAFIPPSQYLVKRVAERKKDLKSVRVASTVVALEDGKPTSVHFKEVTEFEYPNGNLVSRAYDDDGNLLFVTRRVLGPAYPPPEEEKPDETPPPGMIAPEPTSSPEDENSVNISAIPVADFILFNANVDTVTLALLKRGVPVKVEEELLALETESQRRAVEPTHIKRYGEKVAWVVGDAGSGGTPQLWVEKDSFIPMKLQWNPTVPDVSGTPVLEFEGFRYFRSFPYPAQITYASNGTSRLRAEMTRVEVNPSIKAHGTEEELQTGYTEAGMSADPGVRDLIDRYYGILR